ncbi:peptidoglycan-binding protein [Streptomyces cellulosae]|nr:peptidoglycan-binding protein [Streptomyces cellulosae]
MAYEPEARDRGQQPPGEQLSRLLRRWWEEAGSASGGTRPTQQALASKLGVDQTTLSRYLNPKHTSTAPLRVVEALHAHLRAPAAELERARELCRAVLRETSGPAPGGDSPRPGDFPDATGDTGGRDTSGRPGRMAWARPVLVAAVMVVAFAAGAVVRDQFGPGPGAVEDGAAAGALAASGAPLEREPWPLLKKREQDWYTVGRALEHLLNAHGHEVRPDGFFTQETEDAVMEFQRAHRLSSDGKVGEDTWPELVVPVGRGDDGHAVRALQELLHNTGQGGTEVSGQFTAATAKDLKYFQDLHRLRPTGKADVDTWLALLVHQRPPGGAPAYQEPTSPTPSTPA